MLTVYLIDIQVNSIGTTKLQLKYQKQIPTLGNLYLDCV